MFKSVYSVAWVGDTQPVPEPLSFEEENLELAWAFRPIVLLLRYIGIDLNWGDDQSRPGRFSTYSVRLFWLLNSIVLVYADSYFLFDPNHFGTRWEVNMIVHVITLAIRCFGIYCALLLATWKQGHGLVESFKRIETRFKINQQAVKKVRRIAMFGAVITVISVSEVYFTRLMQIIKCFNFAGLSRNYCLLLFT